MKKVLGLLLVLGLGVMVFTGCSSTSSSSTPTETLTGTEAAVNIAQMVALGCGIDTTATSLMGTSIGGSGIKAMAVATDLVYSGGWWNFSYTAGEMVYTFKARVYNASGIEITTTETFATIDKIKLSAALTISGLIVCHFGSDSDPLTFAGLQGLSNKTIDGPISITVTDEDSNTYTFGLDYDIITLDSSGLPESGVASFSFSSTAYVAIAGSITFNGATASIVFTAPPELTGPTYTVYTATGTIEGASL